MIFGKEKAILTNISEGEPWADVFLLNVDNFIEQGHYIILTWRKWDKIKNSLTVSEHRQIIRTLWKLQLFLKFPSSQLMATATSWVTALDSFYSTYKIKGINVHSHKTPLLPESNQSRTDFISLKLLKSPNTNTQCIITSHHTLIKMPHQ